MLVKGTAEYQKASELASKIIIYANTTCYNTDFYDVSFGRIYELTEEIKKIGGFAGQVAESVSKTLKLRGFNPAKISQKQAWILACAMVENNIELYN